MPPIQRPTATGLRPTASRPAASHPTAGPGLMLVTAILITACAAPKPAAIALSPADYAWCNATRDMCTGWRGPGPFIGGATTPVGVWILPAADAATPQLEFLPGEPIVSGDVDDFY